MANEYLKRTPTSTGNRKVFTWSGWVKQNTASTNYLLTAQSTKDNNTQLRFLSSGVIDFFDRQGNDASTDRVTFLPNHRDYSSWLHVIISGDTTKINPSNRVKAYVNGVELGRDATNTLLNNSANADTPTLNQQFFRLNGAGYAHYIGAQLDNTLSTPNENQFSDIFYIDGQQLDPDVFGFYKDGNGYISAGSTQSTDFRPGQWVPHTPRRIKSEINRRGGFGVNGFYLPMNSSNNFGADFHCEPDTILKLKSSLPQPKAEIDGVGDYTGALRDDPFKQYLVLAIPFVSGGLQSGAGDYSADIKGSGTNKTVTLNGTFSVGECASYYGSALKGSSGARWVEVAANSDFANLYDVDHTIEFWYKNDAWNGGYLPHNDIMGLNVSGSTSVAWRITFTDKNVNNQVEDGIELFGDTTFSTGQQILNNDWNHCAVVQEGNNTTIYINGVAQVVGGKHGYSANKASTGPIIIGADPRVNPQDGSTYLFNGQLQDIRIYKGVAKYKGGFDVPKPYTPVGIESWRAVPDTTANNFATMNSLYLFGSTNTSWVSNITLSDGNLSASWTSGTGSNQHTRSSIAMLSGKWYFEGKLNSTSGADFGIAFENHINDSVGYGSDQKGFSYRIDGQKQNSTSATAYGSSYGTSDIIGVTYDADAGEITFYKNGVSQGIAFSGISIDEPAYFGCGKGSSGATQTASFNFGQNPTFSGNTTAGTFTDSNGKGLFKYAPPTGFLALCEDNLPTPAIADPGDYMRTVLYTGDDNNSRSITGVGFQPDLVWIKQRNSAENHQLQDSVRGATNRLFSNLTAVESPDTSSLLSFDSNGFSLGTSNNYNGLNGTYVAWCWKAGGAAVSNSDGSITSQVSVNQTAGFSIVSYDGTGSNSNTGHGLSKTPDFIIWKAREDAYNWDIYHSSLGYQASLIFTTAATRNALHEAPTSTTIPVTHTYTGGSANGKGMIAYCWAEIEGFSKFGSYVGNGSVDGPFVYCGFKPAWVMIKCSVATNSSCTSGGYNSWAIYDNARDSVNPAGVNKVLWANRNYAEGFRGQGSADSGIFPIDFLSNGFKIRSNGNCENNVSNSTFIFAAFAESPFQTANSK